jgi:hypothetical protein
VEVEVVVALVMRAQTLSALPCGPLNHSSGVVNLQEVAAPGLGVLQVHAGLRAMAVAAPSHTQETPRGQRGQQLHMRTSQGRGQAPGHGCSQGHPAGVSLVVESRLVRGQGVCTRSRSGPMQ